MNSLAIIIPCYNEAKRFQLERFTKFIQNHPSVILFFVDDGSTDSTPSLLKGLRSDFGEQVQIFTLLKNKGKAEAVRTGMTEAIKNIKMERFAFLDADLATSLEECYEIAARISDTKAFVFCGHVHPGVRLQGVGRQQIKLPCFYHSTSQLILPAFGAFTGLHILKPKLEDHVYVTTGKEVMEITEKLS